MRSLLKTIGPDTAGLVAALLALACLQPVTCQAKVRSTTLENLAKNADSIVLGKVTRLVNVGGTRVAEVAVSRSLKGAAFSRIYYLAQPTWICDISAGQVNEEALFFLEKYTFGMPPEISPGGDDEENPFFKEPRNYAKKIKKVTGGAPFFLIEWSGRGFMPARNVGGTTYVTLWTGDVKLPPEVVTIDGPEPESAGFIRSVPLDRVIDFVVRVLGQ